MLNPHLDLPALQLAWAAQRNLRVTDVLKAEVATALLAALRLQPYQLRSGPAPGEGPGALGFQYGECTLVPEVDCDHVTCAFARWWHGPGRTWLAHLTGMALTSPEDARIVATLYGKGCYLEAHNDFDGQRALAYVLGLTPGQWPAEEGGHLEFLAMGAMDAVVERRPPGFNTLDIFDVSRIEGPGGSVARGPTFGPVHRIPLVTQHVERRAISGWFGQRTG